MRNATDALAWVLREAIEISNGRRSGLKPAEAREEWADLLALCDLLADRGVPGLAKCLRDELGEA